VEMIGGRCNMYHNIYSIDSIDEGIVSKGVMLLKDLSRAYRLMIEGEQIQLNPSINAKFQRNLFITHHQVGVLIRKYESKGRTNQRNLSIFAPPKRTINHSTRIPPQTGHVHLPSPSTCIQPSSNRPLPLLQPLNL